MPKDNFNPAQGLPIARQTRSVTFHAIHESKSRFSNHPVVSVAWPDTFLSDRNLIIYVEVRTSVPELLKDINEEDASGYILFQLTKDGEICYCSHQEYANQDASALCFDGSELFGTITLFVSVYYWNEYFQGLVLSNSESHYPLQTYIRQIVVSIPMGVNLTTEQMIKMNQLSNKSLNAAKVFITIIPMLAVYPFIQKYFVTGIMIGSVKE